MGIYSSSRYDNIFLAPIAGMSDAAMRGICGGFGAAMCCTEMVSLNGLAYGNSHTWALIDIKKSERRAAVQVFGGEARGVKRLSDFLSENFPGRIAELNINMGCPVRKVAASGGGAVLMKDMAKAAALVGETVRQTTLPVTVKFRSGWDGKTVNAVEFALMCENEGASAVIVHGRTADQMYRGRADREIIAKVKSAVNIPVIGNGDIYSAQDAKDMFEQTGCDGVMVARGALGNPFIFREIRHFLDTGEQVQPVTAAQRLEVFLAHSKKAVEYKGEFIAMREMRRHAGYYIKGFAGSAKARARAVGVLSLAELEQIVSEALQSVYGG